MNNLLIIINNKLFNVPMRSCVKVFYLLQKELFTFAIGNCSDKFQRNVCILLLVLNSFWPKVIKLLK